LPGTAEDLLVMSAASCFALTLAAVAERHDAPLLDATVTATGHAVATTAASASP
jgi:organic hydroperoxide reductase OsmC/OhrA